MEVAEIVSQSPESAIVPVEEAEAPVAPEDVMLMLESLDEEEDDDSVHMSELIALASLVEDEPQKAVEEGEKAPAKSVILPGDGDEEDGGADDLFSTEQLSPAERVIMGTQTAAPTEQPAADEMDISDPSAYARQQLAQLSGGAAPTEDTDQLTSTQPTTSEPATAGDAADYARQQLEALSGGAATPPSLTPTAPIAPAQPEPVDPRQIELGRRFRETEQKVQSLRQMVAAGQMSQQDFIEQLRDAMVLDDEGVWWMMGVESDQWYRAENNTWIEATPPPLLALQQVEPQQFAPPPMPSSPQRLGDMLGGSPGMQVDDSLPYLDQAPTIQTGRTEEQSVGGIRLDENFMPLPDQVPLDDPDATIAGPSAFESELGGYDQGFGDQTMPSRSYSEPTQQAQAFDYGGTIQSPSVRPQQDYTTAPDYGYDESGEYYQEAVEEQRRSTTQMVFIAAAILIGLVFILGAAFIFLAISWYSGIVDDWQPQITALRNNESSPLQTVKILDINGREIASIAPEGDDRRPVDSLNEISPLLIHAFLTLEDDNFFENPGWNFTSTIRAFTQNLFSGEITSGGSTITQQVARNLVLDNTAPTAERKINEIVVAGELTQQFTKDEILLMYLNNVVFFGNQAYGVEAASQFYFDKSASELNAAEAALLASIPSNPANNEPVNNNQTAKDLMLQTLARMELAGCLQINEAGQEFCVTADTADPVDVALTQVMVFEPRRSSGLGDYPHFTQLVLNQLSAEYGDDVFRSGFVVTTTLDSRIQNEAQRALANRVGELGANGVTSGAVMVTDPRTGAILAMVGSPDFENEAVNGQFNYALGYNQPGSAIKPITYTASFIGVDKNANGLVDFGEYYTPATVLWDVPTSYQLQDGTIYAPRNIDNQFRGNISLRSALQNSYNVPAVQAYQFIGADAFRTLAERMGIRFLDEAVFGPAAALGATEVRLVDMMEVYGTLANKGTFVGLHTLASIVDNDGNSIPIPPLPEPQPIIDPQIAFLMQNILSDDASRAAAFGRNSALTIPEFSGQPLVAAKSGTTDGRRDLWTMGFTSNYVVGVWLGTFDDTQTFGNLTGSTAAGPVWNQVLRASLNSQSPSAFSEVGGGINYTAPVCPLTGAINDNCTTPLRNEWFGQGHPPPDAGAGQGLTRDILVDSWTGYLANNFCPQNQVVQTYTTIDNPAAIEWINTTAAGQAYARSVNLTVPVQRPPTLECDINTQIPNVNVTMPVPNERVQGAAYVVQGQINANEFARYEFHYALAGSDNFQPVPGIATQTSTQPNPNSPLATWDTTLIPNGNYTLRLAVFSETGGFIIRDVPITINNPEPTPVPTIIPTQPPVGTPIPFDTLPPGQQSQPVGPTPTLDTSF